MYVQPAPLQIEEMDEEVSGGDNTNRDKYVGGSLLPVKCSRGERPD